MRSRAFLFEDEPMPHQPRNPLLVVVASIHEMPRSCLLGKTYPTSCMDRPPGGHERPSQAIYGGRRPKHLVAQDKDAGF
jgi:hypothetical protein